MPGASSLAPMGDNGQPDTGEGSSLRGREILAIVRANAALIMLITLATFSLALVAMLLITPRYTAMTTVQINDQAKQILAKNQQDDTNEVDSSSPLETERFLQTQINIINSRSIAERVAHRLNLMGSANFFRVMGRRPPQANASVDSVRDATLQVLLDNENGELQRNSRLVSISFTSTDPAFSTKVANAWADEFIQANLQRRYDSSAYARSFVFGQLNEAKAKLEQSERDLNAYARSMGIIKTRDPELATENGAPTPNSVTTQSLLELNSLANQATQQRINAENRWRSVAGGNLLSSPEVLSNSTVATLLTERAKNEQELQHERAKHLDDYPTVRQLIAQNESLNKQISEISKNIRDSLKQQYESSVQNETTLKAKVGTLKSNSLAEQDRGVQYNLMARDSETNRVLYESLLQRYKDLTASAGITASNISVIDAADVPIRPSSPKIARNLAIALFAGLLLSGAVIATRQTLDDAVKIPEDVENKLGMTLLGVIPKSTNTDLIEALSDPKSTVSESYNSLRSSLLYSTSKGLPQTLLVTSSLAAEGKSTTSRAMAIGFAKLGHKVLLIDVDMRRPSVHAIFGLKNKAGLSSLLTQQDTIENVLAPSGFENLWIIPSGPIPPSPTDLLSSNHMSHLLEQLGQQFDLILLDSPPVMGLADAPLLAAIVQGVIVVIQADRSRRGSLKNTLRRLRGTNANILGGVLTMFDPAKAANRYSEYYSYNYNYYYYSDEKNA